MMRRSDEIAWKQTLAVLSALTLTWAASPALTQEAPAAPEETEPSWEGTAGLAVLLTSGNTETESLGLDIQLTREPAPRGFELKAQLQRAEDSGVRTAERYLVGLRGTRTVSESWNVYAGVLAEQDEFAGLDLRKLVEAGFIYQALASPRHRLDVDLGLTWTDEDRIPPEPDSDSPGALAGLDYSWKISETASFTERFIYYPNFDDSDDWRVDSTTALTASLSTRWALQLSYELRFRNQPIGDRDDTDATTKASLVLNL